MSTISTTDASPEQGVFWDRHKTEVMFALIAILVAVAAFGGYRFYSQRQANAGAEQLATAKTPGDFQKVIADYSNTPAGASAYILLAESQKNERKFSEANTTLETFLQKFPKHELTGTARLAMAGNLEALGKKDEALATYQKLATSEPQAYTAPVALFSQVHLLKEKNQIAEARRICETIMTQYRESRFAAEATYQLRTLKLPDQPAASPAPSAPIPPAVTISSPAPVQPAVPSAAPPGPNAAAPSGPPKKP
ncbi:MAG: YfgM family protein [Chthoniobacterales bacterium]